MTPEERFERIERMMEFIVTNQARYDAQIADNSKEIKKYMRENSRQIREHSRQIQEQSEQIRGQSQQIGGIGQQLGQLTGLTLRLGRAVEQQGNHIDRVAERVDILVNVIERHFPDGPR